jgi:hypothetical protein
MNGYIFLLRSQWHVLLWVGGGTRGGEIAQLPEHLLHFPTLYRGSAVTPGRAGRPRPPHTTPPPPPRYSGIAMHGMTNTARTSSNSKYVHKLACNGMCIALCFFFFLLFFFLFAFVLLFP